ncbi:hypothetical protein E2P81_ATG08847 [Venturia nashicola]|nr:hypothetical protein E2P81_ATG08847 [Venturia nashicola]
MTAPALLPQAAQFTCAPTVPAAECLASSSAFSACLAQNITASDCFNRTQNTANLTTQAPDPTPTTPSPPILTQPGYAPCTLTSPGSTNVIILDECPPDLPQPLQTPLLPPTVPVIAGTGTGTDEGEINLLPTPTDPRVREMETPTGSWTTCVQNNLLTCNNALCTSDPNYAPRCTDTSPPRKEGRNLCIDGLPNRCQGSDCVFINETQGTSDSEETDMKTNPQIDYEGGICKGWVPPAPPPIPIPIPARPANNLVPTKTCAGPGVGRPRENGLGVVESGEERVWAWQNGDCYS